MKVLYDESHVLADAYGTEILDVQVPYATEDEKAAVYYVQDNLAGIQMVDIGQIDDLEAGGKLGLEVPVRRNYGTAIVDANGLDIIRHSEEDIVVELCNRGQIELQDLAELPNKKDLGPVLSDLLEEAVSIAPEMVFLEEDNLDELLKKAEGFSVEEVCKSIEADLEKFPSLRDVIDINPDGPEEGEPIVTCYIDFPSRVAVDYDREKQRSANPFMMVKSGEKAADCVKEAVKNELDVIEFCKEQNVSKRPRNLEEALFAFGHTSGKQVLKMLNEEAHSTEKRKGAAVLDGAFKYESQYDRKEALKQVKGWMKKPCDKVAEEIEKLKEKNRQQGR